MPATIRFDTQFQTRRSDPREAIARALPHRKSYLGFALGLMATVVVACAGLGWWLVQSGIVEVRIAM